MIDSTQATAAKQGRNTPFYGYPDAEPSTPVNTPPTTNAFKYSTYGSHIHDVPEVAELLKLKPTRNGTEFHGANPEGGATKDGFILFPNGNAYDRATDTRYKSHEVAKLAGIDASNYKPCQDYAAHNGSVRYQTVPNGTKQYGSVPNGTKTKIERTPFSWNTATIHEYQDENGDLLFQVGRCGSGAAKSIQQRRPDGRGDWLSKLDDTRRVLYQLPDVLQAETVLLVEGEKAADAVNKALKTADFYGEYVATTAPHGAGNFREEYVNALQGKRVALLPDNDDSGQTEKEKTCAILNAAGIAAHVVELPDLPPKGDAADFLATVGTIAELVMRCEDSPLWAPAPKPKTFNFLGLTEILSRLDPEFIIHRMLTVGGTSLLTAKHASFKSFMALDMALCVTTGRLWHGQTVKRGAVVYVAAEGVGGVKKRIAAWLEHHQCPMPENFHVLENPLAIAESRVLETFIEEVSEMQPVLIVLDTLARCAVGLDENSAVDMSVFSDAIGKLARQSGAHVMVVHHNNKTGEYRGSSVLPAAVDTHLSMERSGDNRLSVSLKSEKQKDFEELPTMIFDAVPVTLANTHGENHSLVLEKLDTRAGTRNVTSGIESRVLNQLVEAFGEEGATASAWWKVCQENGISYGSFNRAKTKLTNVLKLVKAPNAGERGAKFHPAQEQFGSVPNGTNVPNETEHQSQYGSVPHPLGVVLTGTERTVLEQTELLSDSRPSNETNAKQLAEVALPEMPTAQAIQKPNPRAESEAYSRPTNEPKLSVVSTQINEAHKTDTEAEWEEA